MRASKSPLEAKNDSIFALPRYCSVTGCNANSVSGKLNKPSHQYVPENFVIYSVGNGLSAVWWPRDVLDVICGWRDAGEVQWYGEGCSLEILRKWVHRV